MPVQSAKAARRAVSGNAAERPDKGAARRKRAPGSSALRRRHGRDPEEKALFSNAIRLARAVVMSMGSFCEAVIHDFSDLEHSVIHIEGELTGRAPGAPATNMVVRAWRQGGDAVEDIVGYAVTMPSGKTLKSSISFLRNSRGEVFGAMCIHFDLTELERFQGVLQALLHVDGAHGKDAGESFPACAGDSSEAIIETALRRTGKHPAAMSREEKKDLVRIMDEEGAFLIKGMVQYLAKAMHVSIYTVYNYVRQIKEKSQPNGRVRK